MAVLGSTAEPTAFIEYFGLNSTNQIGTALTLPVGGPWRIYRLGMWLAGMNATAQAKLVLWNSGGSLLRSSAQFNAAGNPFGLGQCDPYEMDISDQVIAGGATVIVGFWRSPADSTQNGRTSSGSHYHDTAGAAPASFGGFGTHAGSAGGWLYYVAANTAPKAPVITSPAQNAVLSDQTPTIDWTFSDPDGDAQYAYEVEYDNNAGFDSPASTGTVVTAATAYTMPDQGAGNQRYVRVRARDAGGLWSPWSSTRAFRTAAPPTVAITVPLNTVMPLYYLAGSDTTPRIWPVWNFICGDGGTQTSVTLKVYSEAGALLHTHVYTGPNENAVIAGYFPVNGTKYQISAQATCSHGKTSIESTLRMGRVRWGRASYRADLGAVPTTLAVTAASTANAGQVVLEYASSAATTPEPTDWKATIGEVTKRRYVWFRVTLMPNTVASPTSPALNEVKFSYSSNVLVTDRWTLDPQFSVDAGNFVYGTQSLRHDGDGTPNVSWQLVDINADTEYIFSARVKTQGDALAGLVVREPGGGGDIVTAAALPDTDFTRYATAVFNSGARSQVEVGVVGAGVAGTAAWYDALKLEASRVVTPWSPGFLGAAVTLDAGGVQIDEAAGGVFRLRAADGRVADINQLTGRQRFIPMAATMIVDSSVAANVASTLIAVPGLPTHADAVVCMVRFNSTAPNNGNFCQVNHAKADTIAGIVYDGGIASNFNTGTFIVQADESQRVRYAITRAGGTVRMILQAVGYFTNDVVGA